MDTAGLLLLRLLPALLRCQPSALVPWLRLTSQQQLSISCPAFSQVLRSRLQQRMDARALQYTGVGDVIRKTLQARPGRAEVLPALGRRGRSGLVVWGSIADWSLLAMGALPNAWLQEVADVGRKMLQACRGAGLGLGALPKAWQVLPQHCVRLPPGIGSKRAPRATSCHMAPPPPTPHPHPHPTSPFALLQREGIRGFYKGLAPNVLRVMPQSALTFLVYESVMRALAAQAAGSSGGGGGAVAQQQQRSAAAQ